jgi:hypothetical protein
MDTHLIIAHKMTKEGAEAMTHATAQYHTSTIILCVKKKRKSLLNGNSMELYNALAQN